MAVLFQDWKLEMFIGDLERSPEVKYFTASDKEELLRFAHGYKVISSDITVVFECVLRFLREHKPEALSEWQKSADDFSRLTNEDEKWPKNPATIGCRPKMDDATYKFLLRYLSNYSSTSVSWSLRDFDFASLNEKATGLKRLKGYIERLSVEITQPDILPYEFYALRETSQYVQAYRMLKDLQLDSNELEKYRTHYRDLNGDVSDLDLQPKKNVANRGGSLRSIWAYSRKLADTLTNGPSQEELREFDRCIRMLNEHISFFSSIEIANRVKTSVGTGDRDLLNFIFLHCDLLRSGCETTRNFLSDFWELYNNIALENLRNKANETELVKKQASRFSLSKNVHRYALVQIIFLGGVTCVTGFAGFCAVGMPVTSALLEFVTVLSFTSLSEKSARLFLVSWKEFRTNGWNNLTKSLNQITFSSSRLVGRYQGLSMIYLPVFLGGFLFVGGLAPFAVMKVLMRPMARRVVAVVWIASESAYRFIEEGTTAYVGIEEKFSRVFSSLPYRLRLKTSAAKDIFAQQVLESMQRHNIMLSSMQQYLNEPSPPSTQQDGDARLEHLPAVGAMDIEQGEISHNLEEEKDEEFSPYEQTSVEGLATREALLRYCIFLYHSSMSPGNPNLTKA